MGDYGLSRFRDCLSLSLRYRHVLDSQLIKQEAKDISSVFDTFVDRGADAVAEVRRRAKQNGMVRAIGGLQSRRHLARVKRIDAVVIFARQKENCRIGGAVFYMVIDRKSVV